MRQSWPLLTVTSPLSHRSETSAADFPKNNPQHSPKDSPPICSEGEKERLLLLFLFLFQGTFPYITLSHLCSASTAFFPSICLSVRERLWWPSAWPWDATLNGWPWKCVASFREAPARGQTPSVSSPTPPGAAMWRTAESSPASIPSR